MAKNLLYFMYGNVEMAKTATQQLIEICEDENFRNMLMEDLSEYEKFYNRILTLRDREDDIKDVNPLAVFGTKASVRAKTITDSSPEKMSEMLIKGFVRGIEDIEENIKKAKNCREKKEVISLAEDYRRYLDKSMYRYGDIIEAKKKNR